MVQQRVDQDLLSADAPSKLASLCDYGAFHAAPLRQTPFDYVIVPHFLKPPAFAAAAADFPAVPGPGSFPLSALSIRGAFRTLLDELDAPAFQAAVGHKFGIDLTQRPKTMTIRGRARLKDGAIHTDTPAKLISVLLYMNADWSEEGGRLRLLRSPNLADAVEEIAPVEGTLLVFRRSDHSWHGHAPHAGPRRVIQLNWMRHREVAAFAQVRHSASAIVKKIAGVFAR